MKKIILNIFVVYLFLPLFLRADWLLTLNIEDTQDLGNQDYIELGTHQDWHDGFHYGEDEYDAPSGPSSQPYSDIFFFHPEWIGTSDENGNQCCTEIEFGTDYRQEHGPNELVSWAIAGNTNQIPSTVPLVLSWEMDELDEEFDIYLYVGGNAYNMKTTTNVTINQSQLFVLDNELYGSANIWILLGGCAATGTETYYFDQDNDGWGGEIESEFCPNDAPQGWVSNSSDEDDNIFCTSNNIDSCNICDGNNVNMDCNGDCFGNAHIDDCGICSGGQTDNIPNNDQDCNNDCFGNAFIDDCGICSGGQTDNIPNSDQDCSGECFGSSILDDCNECLLEDFNQTCLDNILGEGPINVFANITASQTIDMTWDEPNSSLSFFVTNYNIYYRQSAGNYYFVGNTNLNEFAINNFSQGTFCVTALDTYNNESAYVCTEATDMCSFEWNLHPGANLISFPCIPTDNSVTNVLSSIEESVQGVIGQGQATTYIEGIGWIGALQEFNYTSGYWLLLNSSNTEDVELDVIGYPPTNELTYNFPEDGNYLISYQGDDNSNITSALPDDIELLVIDIIGEGAAAHQLNFQQWIGSLTHWSLGSGYWLKVSSGFNLIWESSNGRFNFVDEPKIAPHSLNFIQSSKQAFYFFNEIQLANIVPEGEDWIISYCNNKVAGNRAWQEDIIDIPVMGYDGSEYSNTYCRDNEIPTFKFFDSSQNELIDLKSDSIPSWENNHIYILNKLFEKNYVSSKMEINAYPNPFNPETIINISIPNNNKNETLYLNIYNIKGERVDIIKQSSKSSENIYKFYFNASDLPSGMYFATLNIDNYSTTKKLMYLK